MDSMTDACLLAASENGTFYLIISGVLGLTAIYLFFAAKRCQRVHQLMLDTKTSLIKDVAPGPAEINGCVRATTHPTLAPYSQRSCVFFRFHVEIYRSSNNSGSWHTYIDHREPASFEVEDQSGSLEVETQNMELDLHMDNFGSSGFLDEPPGHLREVMQSRFGKDTKGLIFNKKLRYQEYYLSAGDSVYVFGQAEPLPNGKMRLKKGYMPLIVTENGERSIQDETQSKSSITLSVIAAAFSILTLVWGLFCS
jgi:hypothetical protein